jgi:hypothetical protein
MLKTAKDERRERDKNEFKTLCLSMAEGVATAGNPYSFVNFEEMLLCLCVPFKTTIHGFTIAVAQE